MPEEKHASSDSPIEPGANGSGRANGGRYVTLLLAGIVVALSIVLAVTAMTPPQESDSDEEVAASTISEAPTTPAPAGPLKVSVSTVRLPTVALAATAEQLQDEAERVADALCEMYVDLPEALHVAAMLNSQIRQSEKAEKLWRRCIELDPTQVAYYVNLAAIAMDRGDSQLAADTLERAIEADCATSDVYHHLAVALTKLGRSEEAEGVIQKAVAAHPEMSACWFVLGQAQLKSGKAAEAESSLRKAIELGSESASVFFSLGSACARQGKEEEAAKFRERFAELKARKPMDKQQRFQILSTAESRRTAVTILCEAAVVHRHQQNSLESERLLHRAIVLDSASPTPYRLLGDMYTQAGMIAEARVVWRRLTEIEPFNFVNYLRLAEVCVELGAPESAEATLKLAIAMKPEAVDGYAALAQFYLGSQEVGKARWFAQAAIRLEPSVEGYQFLASVCRKMGDEASAEAALAAAGQLAPANPQLREAP